MSSLPLSPGRSAGLILIAALCSGCPDIESVPLDQYASATLDPGRLRPDFRALGDQAPSGLRATYSDGNVYDERGFNAEPGGAPLSPLLFADVPGPIQNQLRRAECLWVDRGNASARISHEFVVQEFEAEALGFVIEEVSFCSGFGVDPDTRSSLTTRFAPDAEIRDEDELGHVVGVLSDLDLRVDIRRGRATPDPFNGCDAGDPGLAANPVQPVSMASRGTEDPILFENSVPGGFVGYPACLNQGAFVPVDDDWSLEMTLITSATGETLAEQGQNAPAFRFPTRVKAIPASLPGDEFLISRPLRFAGALAPRVDGDRTVRADGWTWSAGKASDGRWRENFSPHLSISRIRVFRALGVDPDTGELVREYLDASHVDAYSDVDLTRPARELRCDLEPATDETPAACEDAVGFTPTYRIDRAGPAPLLSDLLTWRVEFTEIVRCEPILRPDGTMDCIDVVEVARPVERDAEDLYLEFLVERPTVGRNASGLLVEPAHTDMGDVAASGASIPATQITVENGGVGPLRIVDVALDGPDATDFRVDAHAHLGRVLATGETTKAEVTLEPVSLHAGVRTASLRVTVEDGTGALSSVRTGLRAHVIDWDLELAHPPFGFLRDPALDLDEAALDPRAFQKPLLIVNAGWADLPRGQFSLTGPDANAFSVVRAESEHLSPDAYAPWRDGEEPEFEAAIAPGSSETLFVVYHPDTPGFRPASAPADEAELRIQVGDAEQVIPLRGDCRGACRFEAPRPVAPPSSGGGAVETIDGGYADPLGPGGLIEEESRWMDPSD
ncbi:MAG: hypothetical protein AAGC67_14275 [Myxococcota bacterium]